MKPERGGEGVRGEREGTPAGREMGGRGGAGHACAPRRAGVITPCTLQLLGLALYFFTSFL